jgi:hypothetical protein
LIGVDAASAVRTDWDRPHGPEVAEATRMALRRAATNNGKALDPAA